MERLLVEAAHERPKHNDRPTSWGDQGGYNDPSHHALCASARHLGYARACRTRAQEARELVNAVAFRGFSDTCCSSSETAFDLTFNADGKRTSFAIPAGKVFVVTGIEWNSFSGTPNRQTGAAVILETPGSCDALFINSTAIADGAGNAGNNLVIPNGVRVRAGQRLCMFMSGGTLNSARAFGYFARDN